MTTPVDIEHIPGPRGLPYLGNLLDIDRDSPIEGFIRMAREYGPIFKLDTPAGIRIMVSDPALVNEICDDARFDKKLGPGLKGLNSSAAGNGLFTSETDDPMWGRAHGILMAPFSQLAMRAYMPKMLDLAHQLMDKWSRLNPHEDVEVPVDMTALTLDTIALCGFNYRFNSFYRETPHPFVGAMLRSLTEAQARAAKLPIQNRLRIRQQRQLEDDQEFLRDLVGNLIEERRAQGDDADNTDLLGHMLTGVDRKSGKSLPDETIIANCITFLIAGHETTSGLLSFAIYYLVKNPAFADRARAEVDEILGGSASPTFEQVHRLTYVSQVLEESLRLWPTAPMFTRAPFEDTVIGGQYAIPAGTPLSIVLPSMHRDVGVWGDDAEQFNPDHFSRERRAALPPNAYKPFGTGQRACIGRQFALQEATLVLAMLLQRFDLVDHQDYQLTTRTSLTVKPADFRIKVHRRAGLVLDHGADAPSATAESALAEKVSPAAAPPPESAQHGTKLLVLFGSNLGTAEGIATRLASEGTERGYAVTLGPLDDHVGALPKDGAALVVSASYNGTPPDNAAEFCRWLTDPATPRDAAAGAAFTVFGCGDTAWAATYQKVPTLLDAELEAHGAQRVHPRGEGDAEADFDGSYRAWHADLWSDLAAALELPATAVKPATTGPRLSITLTNRQVTNPVIMSYQARPATVLENRELMLTNGGPPADRSTRHLEIALPNGISYRAGDHLGVLPRNNIDLIRRAMARFGLDAGQYITIIPNGGTHTHLPIEESAPLLGVLGSCVELQDVASRSDIETLVRYTEDPEQKAGLEALVGDDEQSRARYRKQVSAPNRSVLDLLDRFPACKPPFEAYLDMLPPLRPRYYSISSSPVVSPQVCSVTSGVLRAPARSGEGTFAGICSNYLTGLPEQGTAFVFVREPSIPFRPPENPHTPMIMIAAGTGLAPFRGFLQERDGLHDQGVPVGPSLLFFGCRNPQRDELYSAELREFEKHGIVRLHTVCSGRPQDGRKYVQHEMLHRGDEIWDLIEQGAAIFVCGNANTMAPGVRAALADIYRERTAGSADEAQAWITDLRGDGRFVEDIWGG